MKRRHACAAGCGETFPRSQDASLHYAEVHLGLLDPRPILRPVSCWSCAADIPVTRDEAGQPVVPPCPACGWTHPEAAH